LAAVARFRAYHPARQFRTATGLPPHQYAILCCVEQAKQHLQAGTDPFPADVAVCADFSDQTQFAQHFERTFGVTPGQFRISARTAKKTASCFKNPQLEPPTIRSASGRASPELGR
jgi:methylphosphotriester-DNA--protein-cysteine methyltransferase